MTTTALLPRIVIPARLASSRLPNKPLADIHGKPMVVRVIEAAQKARNNGIWVATDDVSIVAAVEAHGYPAILTRTDHPSGTDRIAEVAQKLGWAEDDIVVNVQGDEPLIAPGLIDAVASALVENREAAISTAAHEIHEADAFFNPNVVKVVCTAAGRALYFSRAPLPWARDAFSLDKNRLPAQLGALRHIGLYAYRVGFLQYYGVLAMSPLEELEALEQLRALWHGYSIQVVKTPEAPPAGVDTPADLERVRTVFAENHG